MFIYVQGYTPAYIIHNQKFWVVNLAKIKKIKINQILTVINSANTLIYTK